MRMTVAAWLLDLREPPGLWLRSWIVLAVVLCGLAMLAVLRHKRRWPFTADRSTARLDPSARKRRNAGWIVLAKVAGLVALCGLAFTLLSLFPLTEDASHNAAVDTCTGTADSGSSLGLLWSQDLWCHAARLGLSALVVAVAYLALWLRACRLFRQRSQ